MGGPVGKSKPEKGWEANWLEGIVSDGGKVVAPDGGKDMVPDGGKAALNPTPGVAVPIDVLVPAIGTAALVSILANVLAGKTRLVLVHPKL